MDDIRAVLLRLAIDLDEIIAEEAATTISQPDTLHLFSMPRYCTAGWTARRSQ